MDGAGELPLWRHLGLSHRQQQILQLLAQGMLYKEIADQLRISVHTVHKQIHQVYLQLHVTNRTEAVNKMHHPGG